MTNALITYSSPGCKGSDLMDIINTKSGQECITIPDTSSKLFNTPYIKYSNDEVQLYDDNMCYKLPTKVVDVKPNTCNNIRNGSYYSFTQPAGSPIPVSRKVPVYNDEKNFYLDTPGCVNGTYIYNPRLDGTSPGSISLDIISTDRPDCHNSDGTVEGHSVIQSGKGFSNYDNTDIHLLDYTYICNIDTNLCEQGNRSVLLNKEDCESSCTPPQTVVIKNLNIDSDLHYHYVPIILNKETQIRTASDLQLRSIFGDSVSDIKISPIDKNGMVTISTLNDEILDKKEINVMNQIPNTNISYGISTTRTGYKCQGSSDLGVKTCVPVDNLYPQQSLEDCKSKCHPPSPLPYIGGGGWSYINSKCVPILGGNGKYPDKRTCLKDNSITPPPIYGDGWRCNEKGECVNAFGGKFSTKDECQDNCQPLTPSPPPDGDGKIDPFSIVIIILIVLGAFAVLFAVVMFYKNKKNKSETNKPTEYVEMNEL